MNGLRLSAGNGLRRSVDSDRYLSADIGNDSGDKCGKADDDDSSPTGLPRFPSTSTSAERRRHLSADPLSLSSSLSSSNSLKSVIRKAQRWSGCLRRSVSFADDKGLRLVQIRTFDRTDFPSENLAVCRFSPSSSLSSSSYSSSYDRSSLNGNVRTASSCDSLSTLSSSLSPLTSTSTSSASSPLSSSTSASLLTPISTSTSTSTSTSSTSASAGTLLAEFTLQPAFRRLRASTSGLNTADCHVVLETFEIRNSSLTGVVAVRNAVGTASAKKRVFVRYSLSQWSSHVDVDATRSLDDRRNIMNAVERFRFSLIVAPRPKSGSRLEFKLGCQVIGDDLIRPAPIYWDTNNGHNYVLSVL